MGYAKTLKRIADALAGLDENVGVYRDEPKKGTQPDFIVWEPVEIITYSADNSHYIKAVRVNIHAFVKDEFPELPDRMEELFERERISFDAPKIQYFKEYATQHWIWDAEVIVL